MTRIQKEKYTNCVFKTVNDNNPDLSFANEGNSSAGTNFIFHTGEYFINNHRTVIDFSKSNFKSSYIYYCIKDMKNVYGFKRGYIPSQSELQRLGIKVPIPLDFNKDYTSLKIQEILVEFIEYHVNRNKWNLEIMNNVSGMIEQLDQNVLPNFFKKEKSVSLKFDTFCKKNGYDLKLSEIDFNETKIDEIVNFKGGKSSYSKPYFSNVDNLGEYEVFTGSLNPVEKIKCINMTDVINEESVSFNKDNDAGSKAFYHNKPYIVGGHHYAVFVKENKKEEIFIKYLYFTFKNLFDNNMFYQSKEPRANSGVIKDFLVKFPKGTNGLTSIEVQKIIVQFIESYLSQIAIMKTATENLKRYFVSHSETIINKTCKL